jgi:hypothetical protein
MLGYDNILSQQGECGDRARTQRTDAEPVAGRKLEIPGYPAVEQEALGRQAVRAAATAADAVTAAWNIEIIGVTQAAQLR